MDELINDILSDLKSELNISDSDSTSLGILRSKVKSALLEVKLNRRYPSHFSGETILKDLENHYSIIRKLALYDYNQYGAEGQTSHSESGESRIWASREDCLIGLVAFCG